MQSGRGDESAIVKAHVSAVIAGALRVFCLHTYHDMMRLYALGIDDTPEENFRAAAIRQLLNPHGVAGKLQDIVERVVNSEDGRPQFEPQYNELISQVMLDYNNAYHAAMLGSHAFAEYRKNVMMPCITNVAGTIQKEDTEHEGALQFLTEIDNYECAWESFSPTRPLECIIHEIFARS